MGSWTTAFDAAVPAWLAIVRHGGWHAPALAAAYAALAAWCVGIGAPHAERPAGRAGIGWLWAGAALAAMALVTLFALEHLAVLVARGLARQQGWYAERREWQLVALVALAALVWSIGWHLWPRLSRGGCAARSVAAGTGLALAVAVLRFVSLHGIDAFLQARLAGITAGRLAEALALVLVAAGLWRHGRPQPI